MGQAIKAGVIGVGHLGSIHARIYNEIEETELVGVADSDKNKLDKISNKFETRGYLDYRDLIDKVDVISIATPTVTHYAIAKELLNNNIHVLLEKPITANIQEAEELVEISRKKGVNLQIGHVERFNPAMSALKNWVNDSLFIEAHRLAPVKLRSMDIGVVLDLMIHDLDIILSVVNSEPKLIQASGVNILTPEFEDIANARIIFENGTVANVTASRISQNPMRRVRFFTPKGYATADFQAKQTFFLMMSKKLYETDFDIRKLDPELLENPMDFVFSDLIEIKKLPIQETEPLKAEINSFIKAIVEKREPEVSGEAGLKAIRLAYQILEKIQENIKEIKHLRTDLPK
ncbi:MAG: Gfo/Idh/MocA family oxidoreductase [Planctomycetes bacterium]|nr:Gfo/Idh/MocA family oxidoreductase [Planctomycetota bacterium]